MNVDPQLAVGTSSALPPGRSGNASPPGAPPPSVGPSSAGPGAPDHAGAPPSRSIPIRLQVNRVGNEERINLPHTDVNTTLKLLKSEHFADDIGSSRIRFFHIGRYLADENVDLKTLYDRLPPPLQRGEHGEELDLVLHVFITPADFTGGPGPVKSAGPPVKSAML